MATVVAVWRVSTDQVDLARLGQEREFAFELELAIDDAIGPFELDVAVPSASRGLSLRDEQITAGDLTIRVGDTPSGRRLEIRGDRADLPARVRYAVQATTGPLRFALRADLGWQDLAPAPASVPSELIPFDHPDIAAAVLVLFPEIADADPPGDPLAWQEALRRAGLGPVEVVDRIYRFCLDGLQPADFSGETDALTALRLGEASCGGKSRLMVAMLRAVGLESRMIGGLLLGDSARKRTSHVWVETRLGDQWVPYDPLNDHPAELPAHFLPLYIGDLPLIVHSRGLAFDYGFRAPLERVPSVWTSEDQAARAMRDLPILRRDQFSLILLAPFALLLVVFMRQVVGLNSIGVFLPVLLGFCVTQVGWLLSAGLLALTLLVGVLLRLLLARLNLLQVPRTAILISFLVLLFLATTVVLDQLDAGVSRGLLVLPLAALAMAVERVTVVALDQGPRHAAWLLLQTLVLATLSALVLMQPLFKVLTVTFPEVLLVVLAEIVVIGQYRGLRWLERWRFRSVIAGDPA